MFLIATIGFTLMYACMYVCLHAGDIHMHKSLYTKSSLYARNEGYREPISNLNRQVYFKT